VARRARRRVRREVGWERVNWYEPNAAPATSRCVRAAGRGCSGRRRSAPSTGRLRETAALFDESSFAKIEVSGRARAVLLERLCDNRVAREVGQITYTQMLNRRGGIECDFTVTRLG
jgi:glycine cleavage system aminomethyltransferase T